MLIDNLKGAQSNPTSNFKHREQRGFNAHRINIGSMSDFNRRIFTSYILHNY
jgi:hypothetical protein